MTYLGYSVYFWNLHVITQKNLHPSHPKKGWIWHFGNIVWLTIPIICMLFGFIMLCFLGGIRKREKFENQIKKDQMEECNAQGKVYYD